MDAITPDGRPLSERMCTCATHCTNDCEVAHCGDNAPWCDCSCHADKYKAMAALAAQKVAEANELTRGKSDHVIKNGLCLFCRSWLSNWESSPMIIDSVRYTCVEQYMMSMKARRFGDRVTLAKIMGTSIPKEQLEYGRLVQNFNDPLWYDVALEIVTRGHVEKYRQNPKLLIKLQQLGDVEFVEANPIDKRWGIGLGTDNPDAADKNKWLGQNLLGQAITKAKMLIEDLEIAGVSTGGGVDRIWRLDTASKFIIGLDQV